MGLKEKIGDVIRDAQMALSGQGAERKFEKDVDGYVQAHGVSPAEAQKQIFFSRFNNLKHAMSLKRGVADVASEDWRGFEAALNKVFGLADLEKFKKDATNSALFRRLAVVPPNHTQIRNVHDYFNGKFGRVPVTAILTSCVESNTRISAVFHRFERDSRIVGSPSLLDTLRNNPELGADIGKILEEKGILERHERMLENEIDWEKSLEGFKKTAGESVAKMMWGAPVEWAKEFGRSALAPDVGKMIGGMFAATSKLVLREYFYAGKLLLNVVGFATKFGVKKIRQMK